MKKLTLPEIRDVLEEFYFTKRHETGSDSYALGYLGSLLARTLAEMPVAKQADIIRNIRNVPAY